MANMREVQQNWAEITQQLLSEPDVYLQFLQFSSHLYGLPFSNAALVFRENSKLTKVATAAGWNSMGLSIRAGEHGIAVFDETNRQNALLFLFDSSQVIDRNKPMQEPMIPEPFSFSAYEKQLCKVIGTSESQLFEDFAQLSIGTAKHFIWQEAVQRLINSHCEMARWDEKQKQQYVQLLIETVRYVVHLRCVQDVPGVHVPEPDLFGFSLFRNDVRNFIRFGTLAQRIYTKSIKSMQNIIRKEELQHDESRIDTNEIVDHRQRDGQLVRNHSGRRTGSASEQSQDLSGKMGKTLEQMDEQKSSENPSRHYSVEEIRFRGDDKRSGYNGTGTIRSAGQAVSPTRSGTGQRKQPESLPGLGSEAAANHRESGAEGSRIPDSGNVPGHDINQKDAEADSPVSASFFKAQANNGTFLETQSKFTSLKESPSATNLSIKDKLPETRFTALNKADRLHISTAPPYFSPDISPWGAVESHYELCNGVFRVSTPSHGGIMIHIDIAKYMLSKEARKEGFTENGYLCFEEDCDACVAERELLDKGLIQIPSDYPHSSDAYNQSINGQLKKWHLDYWNMREKSLHPIRASLPSQTLLLDSIVQINENSESITKEIQSEELIFYFGNTDRADDAWFTESDLLADFAKQHPDMRFALANAVVEYLDEKQHTERNLKDLHAGWYKKTNFMINAEIDGDAFSYEGRIDIGDGKGAGGGSLIDHIRDFNQGMIDSNNYPYNTPEAKEKAKRTLDIFIPFLEAHSELTAEEQKTLEDFKARNPIRGYADIETEIVPDRPMIAESESVDIEQYLIDDLKRGTMFQDGKFRVEKFCQENPKNIKAFAAILKQEYGIGGHSGNGNVNFINYDGKGMEILYTEKGEKKSAQFTWNVIAKKLYDLIESGTYIMQEEIAARIRNAQHVMQEPSSDDFHLSQAKKILKEYGLLQPEMPEHIPENMTAIDADTAASMLAHGFSVHAADGASDISFDQLSTDNLTVYLADSTELLQERAMRNIADGVRDISAAFTDVPQMLGEPYVYDLDRFADMFDWDFHIEKDVSENTVELLRSGNTEPIEKYLRSLIEEAAQPGAAEVLTGQAQTAQIILELTKTYADTYFAAKAQPNQSTWKQEYTQTQSVRTNAENYRIIDDFIGVGTPKERIQANVQAIHTLKEVELRGTPATREEQCLLSEYVGWGGLPQVFEPGGFMYDTVKSLLTEDEYAAARASTLTAFYTPPVVIRAVYDYLERVGITSGNLLEPSCGVGAFLGLRPESMQNCKFYGVELDSISGRIAKQLYPNDHVVVTGYEKTTFADGSFTAAVGNVPFGDFQLSDPKYDKNHFLIHDYFFAKTLDQVCPGGIVAFITSKGTMDKKNDMVRRYIAERAELIGAIRLPNNTFSEAAGTTVTSDILFLRKRTEPMGQLPEWISLAVNEAGITMNAYFVSHPEMILGEMKMISGRFGMTAECLDTLPAPLKEQLKQAVTHLPLVPVPSAQINMQEITITQLQIDAEQIRSESFFVENETLYFKNANQDIMEFNAQKMGIAKAYQKKAESMLRMMITIRDVMDELIQLESENASDDIISGKQADLDLAYEQFVSQYGRIADKDNAKILRLDKSYYRLTRLEEYDENGTFLGKTEIFTDRIIQPTPVIQSAETPQDALIYSMNERGRVDMPYMMELTGKPEEFLAGALTGSIFRNPLYNSNDETSQKYLTEDEYLSGNVRKKLREARHAAEKDDMYAVNVTCLEKVQPKDLEAGDIYVRLGATWIPVRYYQAFSETLFQPSAWEKKGRVEFEPSSNVYYVYGSHHTTGINLKAGEIYGTKRCNGYKVLENLLNSRSSRVYDTIKDADGKTRSILNQVETEKVQACEEKIRDAFASWIWNDPERRMDLVTRYNEQFNSVRPRQYNGAYLNFPGMNPAITLYPHQKNAIARIIYGGNTLLAHTVGAGKTFEMIAAAQELRRLGLSRKNLIVVPNHLTRQWEADFLRLYPTANILVATPQSFTPEKRRAFLADALLHDYDAIIMGHSQFTSLKLSSERQKDMLNRERAEILAILNEAKRNSDGKNFTVKQTEGILKSIDKRLEVIHHKQNDDDTVFFDEFGFDRLFLDEAHLFKNLGVVSKMDNINLPAGSANAFDLYLKTQYMDERTGGKGCIMATGTPLSNSIAEVYTFQKYLNKAQMKEYGLLHFDAWAANFIEAVTAAELAPEGSYYRIKTRFSKFNNLSELKSMFLEFADVQTAQMLHLEVPEAEYHTVSLERSEFQAQMMDAFLERASAVRSGMVDASVDNMLAITNDGRKMALDQRTINPLIPESDTSKASACADNVFRIWQETVAQRSTQLIFSDLSTPKRTEPEEGFRSIYQSIREKLVEKGVPEHEIAFIHDYEKPKEKETLFEKVRKGEVRILLGSTGKMGAGTNVQTRLIALHHLDVPWRPSDIEQREGRIIRRGNENQHVHIYRYITKDTFDAYSWQIIERKQKMISQFMSPTTGERSMEDIDDRALNYAEIKACCVSDERMKEQMQLDNEVRLLKVAKTTYLNQKYRLEDSVLREFPEKMASTKKRMQNYIADISRLQECTRRNAQGFSPMKIGDITYSEKKNAGKALLNAIQSIHSTVPSTVGEYRGFLIEVYFDPLIKEYTAILSGNGRYRVSLSGSADGNITRINNRLESIPESVTQCEREIEDCQTQLEYAKAELEKPFAKEAELAEKSERLAQLNAQLQFDQNEHVLLSEKMENSERHPNAACL